MRGGDLPLRERGQSWHPQRALARRQGRRSLAGLAQGQPRQGGSLTRTGEALLPPCHLAPPRPPAGHSIRLAHSQQSAQYEAAKRPVNSSQ